MLLRMLEKYTQKIHFSPLLAIGEMWKIYRHNNPVCTEVLKIVQTFYLLFGVAMAYGLGSGTHSLKDVEKLLCTFKESNFGWTAEVRFFEGAKEFLHIFKAGVWDPQILLYSRYRSFARGKAVGA
jgi:hypothetical protein